MPTNDDNASNERKKKDCIATEFPSNQLNMYESFLKSFVPRPCKMDAFTFSLSKNKWKTRKEQQEESGIKHSFFRMRVIQFGLWILHFPYSMRTKRGESFDVIIIHCSRSYVFSVPHETWNWPSDILTSLVFFIC